MSTVPASPPAAPTLSSETGKPLPSIASATFWYFAAIAFASSGDAAAGFAPLAIGLTLTLVALIAIPVSNGSFNPARALATAIYGGPDAIAQVWVTIVAPIIGALIAGFTFRPLFDGILKR